AHRAFFFDRCPQAMGVETHAVLHDSVDLSRIETSGRIELYPLIAGGATPFARRALTMQRLQIAHEGPRGQARSSIVWNVEAAFLDERRETRQDVRIHLLLRPHHLEVTRAALLVDEPIDANGSWRGQARPKVGQGRTQPKQNIFWRNGWGGNTLDAARRLQRTGRCPFCPLHFGLGWPPASACNESQSD